MTGVVERRTASRNVDAKTPRVSPDFKIPHLVKGAAGNGN